MPEPFEASSAWAYRFARYTAIPEILGLPEVVSGEPFRLITLTRMVLDRHLSPEQQKATFLRAQTRQPISVGAQVRFYVPFLAKETGQLINLGSGMFRLPTAEDVDEDEVEEAAIDAGEEEAAEFEGWIYAFTFPELVREGERYPIKVGKTSGDVDARVTSQCRSSAAFDVPRVVGRWPVNRVGAVEAAVHGVLRARGQWRERAPGTEWFNARPEEVEQIIAFIVQGQPPAH